MRQLLGVLLFILGVVVGLYVGLWLCFVGGFLGLFNAIGLMIAGASFPASLIAWSIIKIALASLIGWISASVLFIPALAMFK